MILKKTIQYSKYTYIYIYLSIHLFFLILKQGKLPLFLTCLLMDYSIMSIIYSLKYWTRLPSVGQSVSPSVRPSEFAILFWTVPGFRVVLFWVKKTFFAAGGRPPVPTPFVDASARNTICFGRAPLVTG